ncbi:hypothetical protein ACFW9I_03365 [[Kitasatospora] papulosa]
MTVVQILAAAVLAYTAGAALLVIVVDGHHPITHLLRHLGGTDVR